MISKYAEGRSKVKITLVKSPPLGVRSMIFQCGKDLLVENFNFSVTGVPLLCEQFQLVVGFGEQVLMCGVCKYLDNTTVS